MVFLPFTVNVPGPYAYLENGLSSILASRLAARAGIQPVSEGKTGRQLASLIEKGQLAAFNRMLAAENADYLVIGSLDKTTDGYLLTSFVFQATPGKSPMQFKEPLAEIDGAMQAVDNLSWTISDKVFSKPKKSSKGNGTRAKDGTAAFHTTHPERSYKEGLFRGHELALGAGGMFELVSSRRSKQIFSDIMDMNVADIDGDGSKEILLLTNSALFIYAFTNDTFRKTATIDLDKYLRLHSITYGDFDDNGIPELFISGNNGNLPSSSILTLQGKRLKVIQKNIPYYLHAVSPPGEKPVLYGQVGGVSVPHGGAVYELQRQTNGKFTRVKFIELPKGVSVYDFVQTDITGNGEKETIAITLNNRLQVLDAANKAIWTSSDRFGAGRNFFGTLSSNEERTIRMPAYIKSRIVIEDIDLDGKNDIVVGRNQAKTVPFMPRLRYFDGSSIMALSWKANKLKPLWETKATPGYTVNYQIFKTDESSPETNLQLIACEAGTSYPFAFWKSSSAVINSLLISLNSKDSQPDNKKE